MSLTSGARSAGRSLLQSLASQRKSRDQITQIVKKTALEPRMQLLQADVRHAEYSKLLAPELNGDARTASDMSRVAPFRSRIETTHSRCTGLVVR